jgi:phosphoserine phosphatase
MWVAMADSAKIRVRTQNLSWRQVGDEVVILDLDDTVYLTLNPSGAILWEALAEGATETELVEKLTGAFGISEDQAHTDLEAFLDRCRQEKLLENSGG